MNTQQQMEVTSPEDYRVVGKVPDMDGAVIVELAQTLREHQRHWQSIGPKGRRTWLFKFSAWMQDHAQEIGDLLVAETGKVRADVNLEITGACDMIEYYARRAPRFLADKREKSSGPFSIAKRLVKTYHPYPLVGIITPWNFPIALFILDAIPALAAGCAVIEKPSEESPLAAQFLCDGWREIGAPHVLGCVTGGALAGQSVVDVVDYIQFTGSTATGKIIAQRAAGLLKPYSLELGGKDAAIVLADADLDRAVNGIAWGALFNAGQVCVSVERVYVERAVHSEFVERLTEKVKSLSSGSLPSANIGAMVTRQQVDIVDRHVKDAVDRGAAVAVGGSSPRSGNFYEPTILVDVDHSMQCMTEETFGPVIPIMAVDSPQEAVCLANDSPYGLSASIWTSNTDSGARMARQLQVGAVNINDSIINVFAPPLPHSGWKQSGIGARSGGAQGVLKYCRVQSLTAPRLLNMKNELFWFPYSPSRIRALQLGSRLFYGRGIRQKLGFRSREASR